MNSNQRGYLIIEVLMAIVILSMIVFSLFSMVSFLQTRTQRSVYESQGALLTQEGMEISHTYLLANWGLGDGVYSPLYLVDEDSWVLELGSEDNLQSLFKRSINISKVCRDSATGEQINISQGNCPGVIDPNSRNIETVISWNEKQEEKQIKAKLLVLKVPE